MPYTYAVHGLTPRAIYLLKNRRELSGFLGRHKKKIKGMTVTKAAPMPRTGKPKKVTKKSFGRYRVRYAESFDEALLHEDLGFQGLITTQRVDVIPPEDSSPPTSCEFYDQEGFCTETGGICPHFESTYLQCRVRQQALVRPSGSQTPQPVPTPKGGQGKLGG